MDVDTEQLRKDGGSGMNNFGHKTFPNVSLLFSESPWVVERFCPQVCASLVKTPKGRSLRREIWIQQKWKKIIRGSEVYCGKSYL
uniref:Ovule protein n=1 Tax=Steinernema glaseri TaxID=37863 RepID=A0A1I7Z9N5_9BILA